MKKCPFCAEDIQDDAVRCKHCSSWMTDEVLLAKKIKEIGSQKFDLLKGIAKKVGRDLASRRQAKVEQDRIEAEAQEFKILGARGWTEGGRRTVLKQLIEGELKAGWDFVEYLDQPQESIALFANRKANPTLTGWQYKIVPIPMIGTTIEAVRKAEEKDGWEFVYFHKGNEEAAFTQAGGAVIPTNPLIGTLLLALSAGENIRKGVSRYSYLAAAFRKRRPHEAENA